MINSHYIPQFILRHFLNTEKIQYCDLKNKKVESRNTKSVFSEKEYYPEYLERELCRHVESQFANLLNNKLAVSKYKFSLSPDEMFILKKYLMITVLRYRSSELEKDQVLLHMSDHERDIILGDFYDNIYKILQCSKREDAFKYISFGAKDSNIQLFAYVRDIFNSYTVAVKTNNCKEDFIIPDSGWAGYSGTIHIKKLNAVLDLAIKTNDPMLFQIAQMITPHDYSVFPITRNMAIKNMSAFFKLCTKGSPYHIIFSEEAPNISSALGFGSSEIIEPPKIKPIGRMQNEYTIEIKQLSTQDVCFLNSLLFSNCNNYFAFSDISKIQNTIENMKGSTIDLSFLNNQ